MAQIAWTVSQVPGSLAVTGNQADTIGSTSTTSGLCPRCERPRWWAHCPGIEGEVVHSGS